jgi:hypothetical protein
VDRKTFGPETLAETRARHADKFERMAAFAQREHFPERPMFLTAPPVGRLAVQNSQRFHYYGELRVSLDRVKVKGAERLDCRLRTLRFAARTAGRAFFEGCDPAARGVRTSVWYNVGRTANIDAARVWR